MRFFEPIALRTEADTGEVAGQRATPGDVWLDYEAWFIDRLRAGDAACFEKLVTERTPDVYGLLLRLTQDAEEARDLTQETFLQAFRNIGNFRGEADLKTWLYRIALNQARNRVRWWRRRHRASTISLDSDASGEANSSLYDSLPRARGDNPEQAALTQEREQMLFAALDKLGHRQREIVILRDIEGLSYEEVANAVGTTVGTVKSRLSRARAELRRRLERHFR